MSGEKVIQQTWLVQLFPPANGLEVLLDLDSAFLVWILLLFAVLAKLGKLFLLIHKLLIDKGTTWSKLPTASQSLVTTS